MARKALALVVEDEEDTGKLLAEHLRRELAHVECSPYGHDESRRFAHILSLAVHLGAELLHIEDSPVAVLRKLPMSARFQTRELRGSLLPALAQLPDRVDRGFRPFFASLLFRAAQTPRPL